MGAGLGGGGGAVRKTRGGAENNRATKEALLEGRSLESEVRTKEPLKRVASGWRPGYEGEAKGTDSTRGEAKQPELKRPVEEGPGGKTAFTG